ncbi:MAG TPA: 30S ribosome-binding factor RbfA [Candidatus Saccharicenans sp.]|jgi:ribosome-binding factor A|nr:30S ribosome-binding factor RbfA [Candidatus Saccharicenans sp.]HRD02404.1 30S ribosome-binding factor RbfA [Candidatus Saccharicenans sp.]
MKKEASYRPKRVSQLIQQEISQYLINELPEMTGFLTVTGVEMPADLRTARISVSVLQKDKRQSVLKLLERNASHFRRLLASRLNLRYNPELIFILDTSVDQEEKIDRLLELVKKNEPVSKS